jgi:hypothetical protein
VFPVRYGLDYYILFRRNSVFKGLMTARTADVPVTSDDTNLRSGGWFVLVRRRLS